MVRRQWLGAFTCVVVVANAAAYENPGAVGQPGLALRTAKALVAEYQGRATIDHAVILVRDGRIEAVGGASSVEIPNGYETIDVGSNWIMPGMIDLHSHVAHGLNDLSDSVYLTNPGMRTSAAIIPGFAYMEEAVAGGVTSVLYIPGSASNMGGQGVLLRTTGDSYEDMELRTPGSLKLAQSGNPERLGPHYPQRSFMNWNTRNTFRRGVAYAKRWMDYEEGKGPKPERDLQFDVFRDLLSGKTQVSTHTQMYQVVLMTLTMIARDFKLPVYIDHGTFDGFRAAAMAEELGVPAILGPRQVCATFPGFIDTGGAVEGVAAKYQEAGHKLIGFNTDSIGIFGIQQTELALQSAMGVRYGFNDDDMDSVRGITIVPAMASGLDEILGSIEVGKEADLVVVTGDPNDPRNSVEMVFMKGRKVYDTAVDKRRF